MAIRLIEADARRSADTTCCAIDSPAAWCTDVDVELYLADETTHITGSLKHRRRTFAVPSCAMQRLDQENTTVVRHRTVQTARPRPISRCWSAVHRRDWLRDQRFQNRVGRIIKVSLSFRPDQVKCTPRRSVAMKPAATIWTSSPTRSATDWRGNNNISRVDSRAMR